MFFIQAKYKSYEIKNSEAVARCRRSAEGKSARISLQQLNTHTQTPSRQPKKKKPKRQNEMK